MPDLKQSFQEYDAATAEIQDLEARLEKTKAHRSSIAKAIKDDFGAGPHTQGDKNVIITHKGETYFLKGAKA